MSDAKDSSVSQNFENSLRNAVMEYAMLKHPFYVAWSEGRLSQEILGEYAKQYYAHVRAFPTYVSGVHSHCEDVSVRQQLLENLIEEERGDENHPELWLRFAEGLGVDRAEVADAALLSETKNSVARLRVLTQSEDYRAGLAALLAYESQIPEVARTKREGLKSFYGVADERAVAFFRVHESIDVLHNQVELDILKAQCVDAADQEHAIFAAGEAAKALWNFLDGVTAAYLPETERSSC
ncbi:MAG TPA: CADD family putative folate metabolism protein [Pyrinomonadaceae bacterium]|nr:CADD family putative folate metabolism protein [Pyrinomonadaceae bacterium]